ncbi:OmpA family protein [Aureispira]|nr:OmpA family protein [Aureispira sp.]
MKQLFLKINIFITIILTSGCVSVTHLNQVREEKLKIERTLLTTKQKLSDSKRALDKLKDMSSASKDEQDLIINTMSKQNQEIQHALEQTQILANDYLSKIKEKENQLLDTKELYSKELTPFRELQKSLNQQLESLKSIQKDLITLLKNSPEIQFSHSINKGELIISLTHDYLFDYEGRNLSAKGISGLEQIAKTLIKNPDIQIDIRGHVPKDNTSAEKWNIDTRKSLSIWSILKENGIALNKMHTFKDPEINELNLKSQKEDNITEIIIYYSSSILLKLLPIE